MERSFYTLFKSPEFLYLKMKSKRVMVVWKEPSIWASLSRIYAGSAPQGLMVDSENLKAKQFLRIWLKTGQKVEKTLESRFLSHFQCPLTLVVRRVLRKRLNHYFWTSPNWEKFRENFVQLAKANCFKFDTVGKVILYSF